MMVVSTGTVSVCVYVVLMVVVVIVMTALVMIVMMFVVVMIMTALVVVMMMFVMTTLVAVVMMLVVVMVMTTLVVMMVVMFVLQLFKLCREGVLTLHSLKKLRARELSPRGCNYYCIWVMLADKGYALVYLLDRKSTRLNSSHA